jgi:hypothetical protein
MPRAGEDTGANRGNVVTDWDGRQEDQKLVTKGSGYLDEKKRRRGIEHRLEVKERPLRRGREPAGGENVDTSEGRHSAEKTLRAGESIDYQAPN